MHRPAFERLIQRIGSAPSGKALVGVYMDEARAAFGAFATGFYLLGEREHAAEIHVAGLPDRFIDGYERHGREVDPLFESLLTNHAPVHERCLFAREEAWVRQPLYVRCSAEHDVGHYLLGPIVSEGRLVGTMNFGRHLADRPFDEQSRLQLAVLAAHVSASLAALRARGFDFEAIARTTSLTHHELQIVAGVAQGNTNAEIGRALWVTEHAIKKALNRVFQKCQVTSRAALAAWFVEKRATTSVGPEV